MARAGAIVHLKGYGVIKVFRTADPHAGVEHWAISNLAMTLERALTLPNPSIRLWQLRNSYLFKNLALWRWAGGQSSEERGCQ